MKKLLLLCIIATLCYAPTFAQITINELTSDAGNNDGSPQNQSGEFIELYNAGSTSVDISGWVLLDDDAALRFATG